MIALTTKNTSFDEDLAIAVVKRILVYNCKKTFRYVAELKSSSFYGYSVKLTNRFYVVMRLFSNRSQMTSKCGKNK